MKQKKMILGVGALLASCAFGGMMTSCTSESLLQEPAVSFQVPGKVPVVLDIQGLTSGTRAGDSFQAAFPNEKQVSELYAVAFYDQGKKATDGTIDTSFAGKFYKLIPVTLPSVPYIPGESTGQMPYFDLEEVNDYLIYFVANPGADLLTKLQALTEADSKETFLGLRQSSADTRVGKFGDNNKPEDFLMVQRQEQRVSPDPSAVTRLTIVLERAAARFDVFNEVSGVCLTKATFVNAMEITSLFPPEEMDNNWNDWSPQTLDVPLTPTSQDISNPVPGLVKPDNGIGGFIGKIYSYENLCKEDGKRPQIVITYNKKEDAGWSTTDETKKIHFVKFKRDSEGNFIVIDKLADTDADKTAFNALTDDQKTQCGWDQTTQKGGLMPDLNAGALQYIPVQRNHLYRIRVVGSDNINDPVVNFVIEVADWNAASDLGSDDFKDETEWWKRMKSLDAYRFMAKPSVSSVDRNAGIAYLWHSPVNVGVDKILTAYGVTVAYDDSGDVVPVQIPDPNDPLPEFRLKSDPNDPGSGDAAYTDPYDALMKLRPNMDDARYILPSPGDFAALFPNEAAAFTAGGNVYSSGGTTIALYTTNAGAAHYNIFGNDVEDKCVAFHVESNGAKEVYMLRFFQTDRCALYRYSWNQVDNEFSVEIWPLTPDAELVTDKGTYSFVTRLDDVNNYLCFTDKDGYMIRYGSTEFDEVMGGHDPLTVTLTPDASENEIRVFTSDADFEHGTVSMLVIPTSLDNINSIISGTVQEKQLVVNHTFLKGKVLLRTVHNTTVRN